LGLVAQLAIALIIVLIVTGVVWHGVTTATFERIGNDLVGRPDGPVRFRLILQPLKGRSLMLLVTARRMAVMVLVAAAMAAAPKVVWADDANKILMSMSQYLANQKNLSATFDSDIEVITLEVQKIQFASSGHLEISRPNKIRASRTGGYADVEIIFDGKTATVYGKNPNGYVRIDAPGSVDQLTDRLRNEFGMEIPGADLLSSDVYEVLSSDLISGAHIGRGVIDGVECEHLAFRGRDTDWQIWVQLLKQAQAYIGNPLTPMSYAKVARRTARRAAWGNYYYGPPYGAYGTPYGF
jgi:hypothetical protein